MLRAHGLNAGPTQRPMLAGGLAGLLADVPALAVLQAGGTLAVLARGGTGLTVPVVALVHAAAMGLGGVAYGLLFQRAANDRAGGWLFGMAYGFLLWMVAAVPLLQWLPPQPSMVGLPAAGLFFGQLLWGLGLGLGFPRVHRPLHTGLAPEATPALSECAASR